MDLTRVKELMHRQEDSFNQIMAAAANESRDLSPEEAGELDRITAEAERLSAIAARASKVEAERQQIAALPVAEAAPPLVNARVGARYGELFPVTNIARQSSRTPLSWPAFLDAVVQRRSDILNTMTEGTPGAGGYLVPVEYAAGLLDLVYQQSVVLPRATVVPMSAALKYVAAFDFSGMSALSPAGLLCEWLGEGSTASRRTGVVKRITLTAHKLGCFTDASLELTEDATLGGSFAEQITAALATSVAYSLDWYFLNGTGTTQPIGVLSSANTERVLVNRASAGTIEYADLIGMVARLHPACYGKAVWLVNPEALPQLLSIQRRITDSSSPAPVAGGDFLPIGTAAQGFSVLGIPCLPCEKLPQLGAAGDLALVDFSGYCIGLRKEVTVESSNSPQWLNSIVDFRAIIRVDGQPMKSAFTPYSANSPPDAASLSWAIVLGDVAQA